MPQRTFIPDLEYVELEELKRQRQERQKRCWEKNHPDAWEDEEKSWEDFFEEQRHYSPPPFVFPPMEETSHE